MVESGTIKSRDQVVVKSQVEGRTTILWIIDEGTYVKKGDLLMKLDDKRVKDRMEDYEGRLEQDRLKVTQAEEQAFWGPGSPRDRP